MMEGHYVSALMLAINLREDSVVELLIVHGASPEIPIFVFPNGMRETCGERIGERGTPAMRAAVERWQLMEEFDIEVDLEGGETKRL
jgi:hypothetical protein